MYTPLADLVAKEIIKDRIRQAEHRALVRTALRARRERRRAERAARARRTAPAAVPVPDAPVKEPA